jgi:hypothetical protein
LGRATGVRIRHCDHRVFGGVNPVPVNYALRFSGPVIPFIACRVRYGCRTRPHLPVRSFAMYKDAFVPRRFSNNSRFLLFPSPLSPSCTAPLVPQAASPHRPDTTRSVEKKCRSATADFHSLDTSAALSRRLIWPVRRPLIMTPMKRRAFQQVAGDVVMRRPRRRAVDGTTWLPRSYLRELSRHLAFR